MGVSIGSRTRTDVAPATRAAILAELKTLAYPNGYPWCEPIGFPGAPTGPMEGGHEIFRMYTDPIDGRQQQIDFRDDSMMAAVDLESAFDWLHRTARRHGLAWNIDLDGHEFGVIDRGPLDNIMEYPRAMAQDAGAADLDEAHLRAPAIRAKYRIQS